MLKIYREKIYTYKKAHYILNYYYYYYYYYYY